MTFDAEASVDHPILFQDKQILLTEAWKTFHPHPSPVYTMSCDPLHIPTRATVLVVHGLGEHIQRYKHLFIHFARHGIRTFGFDQRGFGRTGDRTGPRGHARNWDEILSDIEAGNGYARLPNVPHFVFGHSMGGLRVLKWAEQRSGKDPIAGVLSSAPAIRPHAAVAPGWLLYHVASFLAILLPRFPFNTNLKVEDLSRDKSVVEAYKTDPYNIGFATLRTLKDILHGGESLMHPATDTSRLARTPLLMAHGSADATTCPESSKRLFDRIPQTADKTYRSWTSLYHELHNEPEKEEVMDDYVAWILEKVCALQ